VAIKVVQQQHTPQNASEADRARAYRESILSTSLAHPNVVATYKICSSRLLDQLSNDALGTSPDPEESPSHAAQLNSPHPDMAHHM
jgi:hypothetical protein